MTFESILGVFLFQAGMFKRLEIKLILLNLKHGAQRSHSEACSLKKCSLPYLYFVFKCLVLYFGIKKEWLEKSLNTFSLAANILNTCTPPISSSYIVLAIKCFPIHHDKHATNFNLCTLVYTSS